MNQKQTKNLEELEAKAAELVEYGGKSIRCQIPDGSPAAEVDKRLKRFAELIQAEQPELVRSKAEKVRIEKERKAQGEGSSGGGGQ